MKLQLPELLAVALPSEVLPSKTSTVLLASAVPPKVGVLSLVTSSLLEVPVSLLEARSTVGAPGAVVSEAVENPTTSSGRLPVASREWKLTPSLLVLIRSKL